MPQHPSQRNCLFGPTSEQGHAGQIQSDTRLVDLARGMVVALLVTVLILAVTSLLWRGVPVLLDAFAGVLFAVWLSTLSGWLSKHTHLPYGWALAVVVTGHVGLIAGIGWFLANHLVAQFGELAQRLPRSLEEVRNSLAQYPWGRLLLQEVPLTAGSLVEVGEFSRVTGLISGVGNFLVTAIVIIFVGIFGAVEPRLYQEGVVHLVPQFYRPRVREAIIALAFNLRRWLVGQVFIMVAIGATTAVGLWLLGIPLALALGLIAGMLELLPYIGPWLSSIPAVLIAVLLGPQQVLETAGLYLGLHILDGYILLPLVQRRAVRMPPALTLLAQVLMGDLLGFMGLFVAAPLTVSGVVLVKMLYVEDTLRDKAVTVPGEPS